MNEPRRYDKYPSISRDVRAMSDEERAAVAKWHRVLTTALEGAIPSIAHESGAALKDAGFTESEARIGAGCAQGALEAWLNVIREVAAILVDPSVADWCCKPGMLTSPDPCPQHGVVAGRDYPLGTIVQKGEHKKVRADVTDGHFDYEWVDVANGFFYCTKDLVEEGGWTVVGHV